MKYIYTVILCLTYSFLIGQNLSNEEYNNLSDANKDLFNRLKKSQIEREEKISLFLKNNPTRERRVVVDNFKIYEIVDIIDGKPIYYTTDNALAASATGTTALQPGGVMGLNLDGSGMTVGVWDGGRVQVTHPEFLDATNTTSRVLNIDNEIVDGDTDFSSHATHVSGTIGAKGVNSSARGMATNVNIKAHTWTNDRMKMLTLINHTITPIILSNHSYGVPVVNNQGEFLDSWIMGAYIEESRLIDELIHNNPQYLMVASAGNNGTTTYTSPLYSGYDKLTTNKTSKNNLVVANANPVIAPFTNEITSLTINSGSSQGPTDDLRIKPDIAADGTNLLSSVPNNAYATFSGTSMAAPNVTGSLVLLQELYMDYNSNYMLASTLKGLVCHTALDNQNAIGPDPIFGWGFLDAKKSAETIIKAANSESLIEELNLANGASYSFTFHAEAGQKLIATICWTDMPGTPVVNGQLNNQTPRLVNDLDLRVVKDGVTYFPWRLNFDPSTGFSTTKGDNIRDNVERVDIDVPETGEYTLTVTHKGTLRGNVGNPFSPQTQDYSLILTGNNLTLNTKDYDLGNSVKVWPNPAKSQLNINFGNLVNDAVVKLYDIQGRVVYNQVYKNVYDTNANINVETLANGVYTLTINSGNQVLNKKIVVN